MASKLGSKQQADQEFDPKYEWQENAANFMLRVHLSGFRKEDFRVQVDGAGRLTVRGQRADGSKHVRFHKVFQVPATSNLDDISGRFDAGVLSLTVPKRTAPPPPAATIDDIRKPAKQEADEAKPKEEEKADTSKTPTPQAQGKDESKKADEKPKDKVQGKEETVKKPMEEDAKKKAADEKKMKEEEMEAKIKKAAADEKKMKEEEMEANIKKAAADEKKMKAETEAKQRSNAGQQQKRKEEGGPTETKPPQAADKAVDRESLLERVRRRAEEERAKAAAEEADRRKKQSGCGGWKERVTEELQGLRSSEWAEGVVDTVKKNKEVIAAAVAAFSLGLFVSSRLFNRN